MKFLLLALCFSLGVQAQVQLKSTAFTQQLVAQSTNSLRAKGRLNQDWVSPGDFVPLNQTLDTTGTTDVTAYVQAAIDYAATVGTASPQRQGLTVRLPPGTLKLTAPLRLPRGQTNGNYSVYLKGSTKRTTILDASAATTGFAAGEGVVMWSTNLDRNRDAMIADLQINMPSVVGTHGIAYVYYNQNPRTNTSSDQTNINNLYAERLTDLKLINVRIEGSQTYHSVAIRLDGHIQNLVADNVHADITPGTGLFTTYTFDCWTNIMGYNGALDVAGVNQSTFSNIRSTPYRGGYSALFRGRAGGSLFKNISSGVGSGLDGVATIALYNSFGNTIEGFQSEGQYQTNTVYMENCSDNKFTALQLGILACTNTFGGAFFFKGCTNNVVEFSYKNPQQGSWLTLNNTQIYLDANSKLNTIYHELASTDTMAQMLTDLGVGNAVTMYNAKTGVTYYNAGAQVLKGNATVNSITATNLSAFYGGITADSLVVTNTFTLAGRMIASKAGAVSAPGQTWTGTWYSGGSATTTKPYVLIEPTGATSTAWSTSGTGIGVNAATGFIGNLMDLQTDGTSKVSVTANGAITAAGSVTGTTLTAGAGGLIRWNTRAAMSSPADGQVSFQNAAQTAYATIFSGPLTLEGTSTASIIQNDGTADITSLRNGTSANSLRVYNTYTDASNYEYAKMSWVDTAGAFTMGTDNAGTGTARPVQIKTGGVLAATFGTNSFLGIGTGTPSSKVDITTAALGVTQTTTSGLAVVNTTAAAVGAQQISPATRWSGFGWGTTAGTSQAVDVRAYVLPVQSTVPTSLWKLQSSIAGGAYADILTVNSVGQIVPTAAAGLTDVSTGIWRVAQLLSANHNTALSLQTGRIFTTLSNAVTIESTVTFAPTSGSVNWSALDFSFTVNQTGGANGVSRGIYINPTLTAATDFRAIETVRGNVIFGTTSGNVGIGDTSPASLLTVGSGDLFQVNSSGNIVKINNVTTSFPASQGAANTVLQNDGSGNLTWVEKAAQVYAAGGSTTLTAIQSIYAITSTAQTVTLPTAVGITGQAFTIVLNAVGTGTIATTSSQTIGELGATATTYTLTSTVGVAAYNIARVISDGSNWIVIGH